MGTGPIMSDFLPKKLFFQRGIEGEACSGDGGKQWVDLKCPGSSVEVWGVPGESAWEDGAGLPTGSSGGVSREQLPRTWLPGENTPAVGNFFTFP